MSMREGAEYAAAAQKLRSEIDDAHRRLVALRAKRSDVALDVATGKASPSASRDLQRQIHELEDEITVKEGAHHSARKRANAHYVAAAAHRAEELGGAVHAAMRECEADANEIVSLVKHLAELCGRCEHRAALAHGTVSRVVSSNVAHELALPHIGPYVIGLLMHVAGWRDVPSLQMPDVPSNVSVVPRAPDLHELVSARHVRMVLALREHAQKARSAAA